MKRILPLLISFSLIFTLAACGHGDEDTSTEEVLTGTVRYMNADPELQEAWQRIAEAYTAERGVPVEIISSYPGTYMTDLNYALNTGSAPVLFDVHSAAEFRQVEPICKNITGQKVLNQVITNAFSLSKDFVWDATGNFGAVGYSIDSYGFLVNRVLLEKAGYHFSDLKDLASLSDIAADIQSRAGELGIASAFSAVNSTEFCSNLYNACAFPTLESSGYAEPQFLEEVPGKMQGLMDVVSSSGPGLSSYNDLSSFIQGRTVFCPAEVNDYSTEMENAIGYENVGFIPLYCGNGDEEKQGLCTNANRFWCINENASKEDQKAALDFISWVAEEETANDILADEMGISTPFVNSKTPRNPLIAMMNESLATRKNPMVNYLDVGYTG